jgi:hypothetical protein
MRRQRVRNKARPSTTFINKEEAKHQQRMLKATGSN